MAKLINLARVGLAAKTRTSTPLAGIAVNDTFFPTPKYTLKDLLSLNQASFTVLVSESLSNAGSFSIDSAHVFPPVISSPYTIFCIGKNYLDHVNEVKSSPQMAGITPTPTPATGPKHPIVFSKAYNCVIGPKDDILHPGDHVSKEVDYEGELALVIGKAGKNISKDKASEHIFGFTVVNDITSRDKQRKHLQWLLGKSLDGFCPIGPFITPKWVFEEGASKVFEIQTKVNGELRQKGKSSNMIFDIPSLIEVISAGLTLNVGDVIATGTPSGVGAGFDPPRFLRPGDEVSVEIPDLGKLTNQVI